MSMLTKRVGILLLGLLSAWSPSCGKSNSLVVHDAAWDGALSSGGMLSQRLLTAISCGLRWQWRRYRRANRLGWNTRFGGTGRFRWTIRHWWNSRFRRWRDANWRRIGFGRDQYSSRGRRFGRDEHFLGWGRFNRGGWDRRWLRWKIRPTRYWRRSGNRWDGSWRHGL